MDMSPGSYESRLDKVSIKYLNAENGVEMKSWRLSQVATGLQFEFSPKTCWTRSLSFLEPKVTWRPGGGRWKYLGLVSNQLLWSSMPSMCV
jgi:hypothetical protein